MLEDVDKLGEVTTPPITVNIKERKVELKDIKPGTIITGMESESEFDTVLNRLKVFLMGSIWDKLQDMPVYQQSMIGKSPTKVLPGDAKKEGFEGALKDWEIVILPTDLEILPKQLSYYYTLEPIEAISFTTRVCGHSTGRGKVLELSAVSTICSCVEHRIGFPDMTTPHMLIATNPNTKQNTKQIKAFLAESRSGWKIATRVELGRTMQAGLPELGKRK